MAYDYNRGNNNTQSYQQSYGNTGQGGAYAQHTYQPQQGTGLDLQALQNANRGGYGGQNVGYQTQGGNYAAQMGGQGGQQGGQGSAPLSPGNYANPYSQYQGFSNFAYPGETGEQASLRKMQEYEAMQGALPDYMDAQRRFDAAGNPVGLGGGSFGGTPPAGGAFGGGDGTEAELRRQREIALQRVADQRDFYNSPFALQAQQSMQAQMSGANSPYPALTTSQLAENADAAGSAFARDRSMAQRFGANSGQTGGGRVFNALMSAQRAAGAQAGQGRRQIRSTNALLEDQRRERARQEATNYLSQQAQNTWNATRAELEMRGRFQVVGDRDQYGATGGGAAQPMLGGGGVSYGGNGFNYSQQSGNGGANPGYVRSGGSGSSGGGSVAEQQRADAIAKNAAQAAGNYDPYAGYKKPGYNPVDSILDAAY